MIKKTLIVILTILILISCNENKKKNNKIDNKKNENKLTDEQRILVESNKNKKMKEIIDNLPEEGLWITAYSENKDYYLGAFLIYNSNKIETFFESSGVRTKLENITYTDNNVHVIYSATYQGGEEEKNRKFITEQYYFDFSKEKLLKALSRYKKGERIRAGVTAKDVARGVQK